jgi:malonyl-CoA/methylmalonyl-CoA synthetase
VSGASALPSAGSTDAASLAAWRRHLGGPAPRGIRAELGTGTIAGLASATARAHPDRKAVRVGERMLTHGELDDQARRLASWLSAQGAGPGSRVLLACGNSLEYVVGYLATLHAGAAVVAVNAMLTATEVAAIVGAVDPVAALVAGERREQLLDLGGVAHVLALDGTGRDGLADVLARGRPIDPGGADSSDIAHLAFTSGTTGRPKPTPLSHGNVLASVRSVMTAWRWRADDVLVHALPLQHGHGVSGLHAVLLSGACLVLVPDFTPEELCRAVSEQSATVMFAVPTMYERLLGWGGAGDRLRGLRLATTGSAGMSPRTSEAMVEVMGQRPLERYGLTETGFVLSNHFDQRVAGAVGIALPGAEVCVVGPDGDRRADGVDGEIVVRGPQVFDGYLGDVGGSEWLPGAGGWFRTGDLGVMDPATGFVSVVGRAKEVIITGGLNVYPREVELALEAVPGVAGVAVVGLPSSRWGEQVTAFVVVAPGETLEPGVLRAHAETVLAAYKRPKEYRVVADLPRNHLGKVVRSVLVAEAQR